MLCYTLHMPDYTISSESAVGKRLDKLTDSDLISYLTFKNNKIDMGVGIITLGRAPTNSIVIENKLASRQHAIIQKIRDAFFIKDMGSTNGTFLNGTKVPADKYVRIKRGDKITIGNDNIVMS